MAQETAQETSLSKDERYKRLSQQTAVWTMFGLLLSGVVAMVAWAVADSIEKRARLDVLKAALTDGTPANPARALAGQVVHVRGTATTRQVTRDEEYDVTIPGTLVTYRRIERWTKRRSASWDDRHILTYAATDARLGGWEVDREVLALADPYDDLVPLTAGGDLPVPKGWALRGAASAEYVYRLVDAANRDDDPHDRQAGDLRLSYRALPAGPLSVIAMADATGRRLVPFTAGAEPIALVRVGMVDAAAMLADESARRNEDRNLLVGIGLFMAWAGFTFPLVWLRRSRWLSALTVLSAGAALLVVGVTALGALAGTAAGMVAGFATLGVMTVRMVSEARRQRLFVGLKAPS